QTARAESIRIKVEILLSRIAPDLVVEIGGLVGPAHMDTGGRRFNDVYPSVAQFLVHERFDGVDKAIRQRAGFSPLITEAGVMLAGPEWDVARAAPKDKSRPVRKPYHYVLKGVGPAFFIWQRTECPGMWISNGNCRVISEFQRRRTKHRMH